MRRRGKSPSEDFVRRRGKAVEDWTVEDVVAWMNLVVLRSSTDSIGGQSQSGTASGMGAGSLESASQLFREEEIDGQVLLTLEEEDLKKLGVTKFGHRRLLMLKLGELRMSAGAGAGAVAGGAAAASQMSRLLMTS